MNNNRNNNNRRRGRGNRNQGGAHKDNRIDSRARGNAPQLLDKYKKLAQDAQHNGDRVQQEYYLQFADHYFRVIADNKARQDEARAKRDGDRGQSNDDDDDDDDQQDDRRGNRRARGRRDDNDRQDDDRQQNDRPARGKQQRPKRGREGDEADANDNPFAADGDEDGSQPKKARAPRKKANGKDHDAANGGGDIDASVLPPSISGSDDESGTRSGLKPRRRRKADDDGDAAEAVNS